MTKLRAAANQVFYLVIFYWLVGTLYLSLLIVLLLRKGNDPSRYMPAHLFS